MFYKISVLLAPVGCQLLPNLVESPPAQLVDRHRYRQGDPRWLLSAATSATRMPTAAACRSFCIIEVLSKPGQRLTELNYFCVIDGAFCILEVHQRFLRIRTPTRTKVCHLLVDELTCFSSFHIFCTRAKMPANVLPNLLLILLVSPQTGTDELNQPNAAVGQVLHSQGLGCSNPKSFFT